MADLDSRHRSVQRRRMRVGLAAFVVVVLVAIPAVLVGRTTDEDGRAAPGGGTLPLGTLTSGAWSSVPVHTSGFGDGSFVAAMSSTEQGLVAVGSRSVDGSDVRAAWFSEDGFTWVAAQVPDTPGRLTAVGADGDDLLAVGTSSESGAGPSDSVWRSRDGGRTWNVVVEGSDLFGPAAPSGRPFVTGILRIDGKWVAVGGASAGSGETWVSDDGVEWSGTFPDNHTGGPALAPRPDGSVLAYWGSEAWTSSDGVTWTTRPPSLPDDVSLMVVAGGSEVGLGYRHYDPYTTPTPLLRSSDGGITWVSDDSFLAAAPDATGWVVDLVDGAVVVGGSESGAARPAAWVSVGDGRWAGMPPSLSEGEEGGGMRLIATVGSKVVMMAGGPVSATPGGAPPPAPSRFFVVDTALVPGSQPAPEEDPSISRPGESAKDVAERVVRQVFGEEMVTSNVEEVGVDRMVTLDSASGTRSVATVVELPDGTFAFDSLTTGGLTLDPRGDDGRATGAVSGPGALTITGLDGQLGSPEVMVEAVPVEGPGVGPFQLAESSWLAVELRLPDGSVLRQLGRR
jgi:hypothetical protein